MRWTRLSRRWVAVLATTAVITLTLVVARLATGGLARSPLIWTNQTTSAASQSPAEIDDDALTTITPIPTIDASATTTFDATATHAALDVVDGFMACWLDRSALRAQWHSCLQRWSTKDLMAQIADAEPTSVPATRILTKAKVVLFTPPLGVIQIGVDGGQVELRLVLVNGSWLVDGVDWSRA